MYIFICTVKDVHITSICLIILKRKVIILVLFFPLVLGLKPSASCTLGDIVSLIYIPQSNNARFSMDPSVEEGKAKW